MAKKTKNGVTKHEAKKREVLLEPRGPRQKELPTMERPRIGDLEAEIEDHLRNEGIAERAKKAIEECKANIQAKLEEHKLSHYDYVDGPITQRYFRERGKEKLKHIVISTGEDKKKAKKERGGDRKKAKKPEPVMPAPGGAA